MIILTAYTAVTCTYGSRKPTHPVINDCICNEYFDFLTLIGMLIPALGLICLISFELLSVRKILNIRAIVSLEFCSLSLCRAFYELLDFIKFCYCI